MKFFKKFFSAKSNEKKYINELVPFSAVFIIYLSLVFVLSFFEKTNAIIFIIFVLFLYQLCFFLVRLSCVSDNKRFLQYKNGNIKIRHNSIRVNYKDIITWIDKARIPDTLYVRSPLNERFVIEIWFETNKIRGEFINKTIWFDNKKIKSIKEFEEQIIKHHLLDINECIEVEAMTEFNDSQLFLNVLEDLKK